MNLENELRDAMREHASAAPGGASLLAGVRQKSRQLTRRRYATTGGALAVIAAIGMVMPGAMSNPPPEAPARESPVAGSPVPTVTPSRTSVVALAGDYERTLKPFPYTPNWMPPSSDPVQPAMTGSTMTLSHPMWTLTVGVKDPKAFMVQHVLESLQVTVSGKPATYRSGNFQGMEDRIRIQLTWQRDGKWLQFESDQVAKAEAIRFAENLRPALIPIKVPFKFSLLPADHQLTYASERHMCFTKTYMVENLPDYAPLCIYLYENYPSAQGEPGTRTLVRGHQATIGMENSRLTLRVFLNDRHILYVHVDPISITSDLDLRDIVEGMAFTDPASE